MHKAHEKYSSIIHGGRMYLTKFRYSDAYPLLVNYIKKYGAKYDVEYSEKLRRVLIRKGYEFSILELEHLIEEEYKYQEYNAFKNHVMFNNPQNLDDYVTNYVKIYGWQDEDKTRLLRKLLDEKNISYGPMSLEIKIDKLKEKIELKSFEKNLLNVDENISITEIDLMSGYDFESFLCTLFKKMNFTVQQTSLSGDQGADLILSKMGQKIVVQAKRHSANISNKAVQEVVAAIKHYNADKGMVVTTSLFTKSAID